MYTLNATNKVLFIYGIILEYKVDILKKIENCDQNFIKRSSRISRNFKSKKIWLLSNAFFFITQMRATRISVLNDLSFFWKLLFWEEKNQALKKKMVNPIPWFKYWKTTLFIPLWKFLNTVVKKLQNSITEWLHDESTYVVLIYII